MVLLEPTAEEKAAIKAQKKLAKKNKGFFSHLTTWLIRLLILFIAAVAMFLFVISRINGESPEFKASIEAHIAQHTPYRIHIGDLNKFSVFPQFIFDVNDVQVYDQRTQTQLFSIGAFHVSSNAFDLMTKQKRVQNFYVDELRVNRSVTGGSALFIEEAYFQPPTSDQSDRGEAPFTIHAIYEELPITVTTAFDYARQGDGSYSYAYQPDAASSIQWLDNHMTFRHQTEAQERRLMDIELRTGSDQQVPLLSGDVILRNAGVHADLKHGEATYKTVLKFGSAITGHMTIDQLDLSKIGELTSLLPQSKASQDDDEKPFHFGDKDISVDVTLNGLKNGDLIIGDITAPVTLKDNIFSIAELRGTVFDAPLNGTISLADHITEGENNFQTSLNIEGLNYQHLSPKIEGGDAHLRLDIRSKGLTSTALIKEAQGNVSFIGAKANMPVSALHIWGNGIVNFLLPKIDKEAETTVNCTIADFSIENGVAQTQSLFLDTKRMTVMGTGEISLADQTINLKLKPSSKDTSLLQFDTAVKISGDLASPSIGPDAASLGITGLKALAGVINPALLLVTMSDLGLSEDHPCHAFIPEQTTNE